MEKFILDGQGYKDIVTNGCASLRKNYKEIDALNVFPVPDGDTGINMRMTIESGANEIKNNEDNSIYNVAKQFSRGMLMGARGNSGVILSQFFRGIYKGLAGYDKVNAVELAAAFESGVAQAYKAVMKPVEGTILTVAREAAAYASSVVTQDFSIQAYFEAFLKEARESLDRTPELLPVLKDAGVVDSGGAGFICIIEGMYKALNGEYIHVSSDMPNSTSGVKHNFNADTELTYGYCTEFIMQLQNKKVDIANFDVQVIIDFLTKIGDSIVCIKDEDIVKVHVHTKTPGEVFNFGQKFGEFITLKIENMQVQHTESTDTEPCNCEECVEARKRAEHKKWAIVMVASGEGLTNTFKEMGVDYVVSGGQTMNPAAEDFVKGFDELNADNILVFPNNSNIIMAAEQAGKYYSKAKVHVVPTKSIAQGYSALTMLDLSSDDIETIMAETKEVISNVTTGLVTYAIRDAEIDDVVIHNGDFMGICNSKITCAADTKVNAAKKLIDLSDAKDKEIVTIIYGKDVTPEELEAVENHIAENYDNLEYESIEGGQDVYSFILAIE